MSSTAPATRRLGAVLTAPHVPRLLGAAIIGRLPNGMAALAIVLLVRGRGGDYGLAGVLAGCYAASSAVGMPVLSRAVDRLRQGPVLLGSAVLSSAGFLALAWVDPASHPFGAAGLVVVAGVATPPLEPCLRVLWAAVLPDPGAVPAAYSLDAAAQEVIFVIGPVIVLGAVAAGGAGGGVGAAAVLGVAGSLLFATARPAREWRGAAADRHWAGPLRSPPLIRLLCALAFVGMTVGVFVVAITRHAEDIGARSAAGWLVAANAGGALIGGIASAMVPPAVDPARRLRWITVGQAAGFVPLLLAPGLAATVPLAVVSGLALPPLLGCAFLLVDALAPPGTAAEAFAWVVTAFGVGSAIGSALAGLLVETAGYRAAAVASVAAGLVASGLVAARLSTRPR